MLGIIILVIIAIAIVLVITARKSYHINKSGLVLITGASTGIGRHAAEHLAKNYSYVVLAGVRKETDAADIRSMKIPNLHPIIVDVAEHDSCVACVEKITKLMKEMNLPFVGLVNNAGVNRHLPAEFQPVEDAKALFNTNVFGVLDLVQLTLPLLRESKGRIIMLSSVSGFVSVPAMGIYSASKFAVEGLSDCLRRELAHFGISVSLIQPAFVKTQIADRTEAISLDLVKDPSVSAKMKQLYSPFYNSKSEKRLEDVLRLADTPVVTSNAIEHALTAQYPKTRYPVSNSAGTPSWILSWIIWLANDRLRDKMLEKN